MLAAIHIGSDPALLGARGALLQSVGLKVVNVAGTSDAVGAIWAAPFDVAVLCHSLTRSDRLNLASAIRQRCPSALIVLACGGLSPGIGERDGMDAVLESDPQRLLQAIRKMLGMAAVSESSVPVCEHAESESSSGLTRPKSGQQILHQAARAWNGLPQRA